MGNLDAALAEASSECGQNPLPEACKVGSDCGYSERHAFVGSVSPRLVVGCKNGGVKANEQIVILHIENPVRTIEVAGHVDCVYFAVRRIVHSQIFQFVVYCI